MDKNTFDKIVAVTPLIQEYAGISTDLRSIAHSSKNKETKLHLEAIANVIDNIPSHLFYPTFAKSLELYQLLQEGQYLNDEELGKRINESPKTTRQRVAALKSGGVQIIESLTKGYNLGGRKIRKL